VHILKGILGGLKGVLAGSKFNKERYLNSLKMMYQFLNKVRKEGLLSVEMDVEKPSESGIFKNFPEFLADHHARDFVCDTLHMAINGGVEPFDMDQMMELDKKSRGPCTGIERRESGRRPRYNSTGNGAGKSGAGRGDAAKLVFRATGCG
jgi:chemotaxis protein MotA